GLHGWHSPCSDGRLYLQLSGLVKEPTDGGHVSDNRSKWLGPVTYLTVTDAIRLKRLPAQPRSCREEPCCAPARSALCLSTAPGPTDRAGRRSSGRSRQRATGCLLHRCR